MRALAPQAVIELWGEGRDIGEMRAAVEAYPEHLKDPYRQVSFKIVVDCYGKSFSMPEQVGSGGSRRAGVRLEAGWGPAARLAALAVVGVWPGGRHLRGPARLQHAACRPRRPARPAGWHACCVATHACHLSHRAPAASAAPAQVDMIEQLAWLPLRGKIELRSPQFKFWLVLSDTANNPGVPTIPDRVYFGREVALGQRHLPDA
jgi:hypothetical protein